MNMTVTNSPAATEDAVLSKSDENIVWLDCEMSGLDPEKDKLLEIALVVTGPHLTPRKGKSGLIDKVKASILDEEQVQEQLIAFMKQYVSKGVTPMCGNTISQDRRFLVKYMPKFEAWFHYRNLDVSTLKELSKRWKPQVYASFKKQQSHTALADVHESIDELVHYREHFLKL